MKKWLVDMFLPMWAKETVLSENRQLKKQLRKSQQEVQQLKMYIHGLESGIRTIRRITIQTGGDK